MQALHAELKKATDKKSTSGSRKAVCRPILHLEEPRDKTVLNLTDARHVNSPDFGSVNRHEVKTVFLRAPVVKYCTEDQLNQLFIALAQRFPALQILKVALPSFGRPTRWLGDSLATFLRTAKKLETLVVWNYVLIEAQQQVRDIAEALRGHACLKHFGLMHVMISVSSQQTHEEKVSLDEILLSLVTVPNLESLQLAGAFVALPSTNSLPNGSRRRPQKLPTAIRNETLVIPQLLGTSSSNRLGSLALRNLGLTDRTGLAIVHALAETAGEPCALKELDVRYNPAITRLTYGELLDSLRINRILHLCNVALDDDQYCQRLHLGFHRSSFAGFPREEIDFYTKRLNTYGRAVFLDPTSATHKDSIQVLINARDDLDALFHLIQYRPSVLVHKHEERASSIFQEPTSNVYSCLT